jgi:hypothetical protein
MHLPARPAPQITLAGAAPAFYGESTGPAPGFHPMRAGHIATMINP